MSRFMHYTANNLQTSIFIYCNIIAFTKHCKLCECKFDMNFNTYERLYRENKLIYRDRKNIVLMRNIFGDNIFLRKG